MQIGDRRRVVIRTSCCASVLMLCVSVPLWLSFAQQPNPSPTPLPPTLGLEQGYPIHNPRRHSLGAGN